MLTNFIAEVALLLLVILGFGNWIQGNIGLHRFSRPEV